MVDYTPEELISDIETHGNNLSDWEIGFVDEMSCLIAAGKSLSSGRLEKLQQIHDDRVG